MVLLVVLSVSLFPSVHFPHLAPFFAPVLLAFPLSPPFPVPWWWGGVCAWGTPMNYCWEWVVWGHRRRVSGL